MTSSKDHTNQRLKLLTFPSLASITLAACGGGGGGPIVQPPPANRAPVAEANKTLTIDEDATNQALSINTPTDADGNSLTITVTAVPSGGTLATAEGTAVTTSSTLTITQLTGLVFTPDANLNDDTTAFGTFTYSVSDGSLTDSSTVTISVTPVNDAPELVGVMEFAIDENTTAIADITATDVDEDTLTYSITGGDDQTFFTIDASTGALSFVSRPDYESSQDSDQDNYYLVQVTVSDGFGGRATAMCVIRVRDTLESGRSLESGGSEREKFDQIDTANEGYPPGIASEHNPLGPSDTRASVEGIVLPKIAAPLSVSPPLLSTENALNLLTELIDPTPSVAIDYQNTLLVDGDDPIGLVQQPLEHSMVTVDLVADLLILDDYDATLNDAVLFWSSELR